MSGIYPDDWPRCLFCDQPALDGHLTCGRACCDEQRARDLRNDEYRRTRGLPPLLEDDDEVAR